MPDTQNVTLTLPVDLLKEARHAAIDRGMSLSKLVETMLSEHLAEKWVRYEEAYRRWKEYVEHPQDLGTQGQITWSGDSLHER